MQKLFKQLFAVLMIAGMWSVLTYAQTGPTVGNVFRDPTDPSINEGASGKRSAGFKQNVNPNIGTLPASYTPFRGLGRALGSLVTPGGIPAPNPADPSTYGFKPTVQQVFPKLYSETGRLNRLFAGFKGIGGVNVTDFARLGTPGGTNPGDPYWIAFPRPGNVETPPFAQTIHHPWDCFCRWDEQVYCPNFFNFPVWHVSYGSPGLLPTQNAPTSCQTCFGVNRIRKHDFYVGQSQSGAFGGYPRDLPADPGYQECLRQSVESYAASGSGGLTSGEPELYGL
jgi:hypothetical protein